MQRWFFNSVTGQCEQFFYGGCLGNENNFPNEEACKRKCGTLLAFPPFYYRKGGGGGVSQRSADFAPPAASTAPQNVG